MSEEFRDIRFVTSKIDVYVIQSLFGYLHRSSDTEEWLFVPYSNYSSTVDARILRAIAVKLDDLNGKERAK